MGEMPFESFAKFSPQARAILVAAQRYAETLNTGLGSEHLLIALTVTPDSVAYGVLRKLPVTLDQIRLVLNVEPGKPLPRGTMAPEAKSVLERAALQAATAGSATITPEHLLWALATDTGCRAHHLFHQLGIDPKTVRKTLERALYDDAEQLGGGHEIEILGVIGGQPLPGRGDTADASDPHDHDEDDDDLDSTTPILDELTTDLTALARDDKLEPLVGRTDELERITHILGRKAKNNPILIGEPGTGKTAIIEGLAAAIAKGSVPHYLQDTRLVSLELSNLVAGTMYRGQFEERLRRMIAELETAEHVIVFIDEIHTLIGAGSAEGALDAANILKPLLAKGSQRVIGATTTAEYKKHIERDAALERRFQPVIVQEPSPEETVQILLGIRDRYERFHQVSIPTEVVEDAVQLAGRYLHDRQFPDKAIDLIDEAAASVRAKRSPAARATAQQSVHALERELKALLNQKEYEMRHEHFERAAYLRDEALKLQLKIKKLRDKRDGRTAKASYDQTLTGEHLRAIVSRWTNIPVTKLSLMHRRALLRLDEALAGRIVGQPQAIETVSQIVRRAKSGFKHPARPLGVFLFVGPTGVGKTELARVLADTVFGSPSAITKLDMSEFMERHQVARLLGAPPGYVGYNEPSRLLETVRRRPHQVILFDEIEKAHPDVFHVLLQLMEDGRLTDGTGRVIHFHDTLIVLTSNIGGQLWQEAGPIGFATKSGTASTEAAVDTLLRERFRPEFLGRLDAVVPFRPLSLDSLGGILQLELGRLIEQGKAEGYDIAVDDLARAHLLRLIERSRAGARDIRRLVQQQVGAKLADAVLRGPRSQALLVTAVKQDIKVQALRPAAPAKPSARHVPRTRTAA